MANDSECSLSAAFIGCGGCGVRMLESWLKRLPENVLCIALDRDEKDFHKNNSFKHKLVLSKV